MLYKFGSKPNKKIGSHAVMIVLPLSVITLFCFSYVLMQSPQKLKKGEAAAASKKPALITGQALPEIDSSPLTDDSNQKLQPDNIDQSPVSADPDTVGTESGSVAPQTQNSTTTTNPQPAASASPNITNNINSSKTKIKVDVGATLNKLMSGL